MLTHLQSRPAGPTRVLLLGARGFIARELARHLEAKKIAVRALASTELDLASAGAAERLAAELRSGDAVVMAAALTPEKGRDVATLMKNLRMAEAVGQAIQTRPSAHLVYLSSDAVYDWRQPLVSEAVAPSPTDNYSLMHLAREKILAGAAAAARVPYAVLRPCAVYGAADTHNSYGPNRFVRTALAEGRIELFGQGEETRDHVAIGDVAALVGLALAHRSTGVLNLVSGRSVSFGELAALIVRLAGRPVRIEHRERSGPVTHRHFDPTALHRSFPRHRPTPLEVGLLQAWSALSN